MIVRPRSGLLLFVFLAACSGASAGGESTAASTAQPLESGVPRAAWIRVETSAPPSATQADGASSAANDAQACGPVGASIFAPVTAHVTSDANGLTDSLLSLVDRITQSPPAVADADHASWLLVDAASPVAHRLDVTRVADGALRFVLSGKPRAASDDAWIGLFQGVTAFPAPGARAGDIEVDFGAMHALDPSMDPVAGRADIHHETTADHRAVHITFAGVTGKNAPPDDAIYTFEARADGSGSFDFVTRTDFDHDGTLDERIDVKSVFGPPGVGQSTAQVSGGSLGSRTIDALECWAAPGVRLYYTDDASPNAAVGNPACCPAK